VWTAPGTAPGPPELRMDPLSGARQKRSNPKGGSILGKLYNLNAVSLFGRRYQTFCKNFELVIKVNTY
jgi:hypothetical protein